jgi:uncharacterized membrane protein (DUF106 family)
MSIRNNEIINNANKRMQYTRKRINKYRKKYRKIKERKNRRDSKIIEKKRFEVTFDLKG